MRPVLLDLFSGAGGSAKGYQEAGFRVVGVDHVKQPRYPGEKFLQLDALDVLRWLVGDWHEPAIPGWLHFSDIAAVHASPPCQAYSLATRRNGTEDRHPRLIEPVRELLKATGLPYVIENVPGAPLENAIQICGSGLGLRVRRHRLFECSFPLMGVGCSHGWQRSNTNRIRSGYEPPEDSVVPVYGGGQAGFSVAQCREAMEIDWMSTDELNEAIPPAYTRHIGEFLIRHLEAQTPHTREGELTT